MGQRPISFENCHMSGCIFFMYTKLNNVLIDQEWMSRFLSNVKRKENVATSATDRQGNLKRLCRNSRLRFPTIDYEISLDNLWLNVAKASFLYEDHECNSQSIYSQSTMKWYDICFKLIFIKMLFIKWQYCPRTLMLCDLCVTEK